MMKNWFASLLRSITSSQRDSITNSIAVIERNNMRAHLYLPSTGRDTELDLALAILSSNGFIITDDQGEIVGKVCTHGLTSEEIAAIRRSTFKIVDEV